MTGAKKEWMLGDATDDEEKSGEKKEFGGPVGFGAGLERLENGPVIVTTQALLVDVAYIDTVRQVFKANIDLTFHWKDHPDVYVLNGSNWEFRDPDEEMFKNDITLFNDCGLQEMHDDPDFGTAVLKTGDPVSFKFVNYSQEWRAPMDLRQFPFDTQRLPVVFLSSTCNMHQLQYRFLKDRRIKDVVTNIPLHDWHVKDIHFEQQHYELAANAGYVDRAGDSTLMAVVVTVQRIPGFILSRVAVVMFVMMIMSGAIFLCPPDDFVGRFSVAVTLFLTAVAFSFTISQLLPSIPYSTRLDMVGAVMYIALFLASIQTCLQFLLLRRDPEYDALTVDGYCAIVYYAAVLGVALWFFTPILPWGSFRTPVVPTFVNNETIKMESIMLGIPLK
eukprot:CAMPEP_0114554830 /NCGR_PEP_ID=MMETSP0114-20121206/8420_1 /TAXON_ID=31324 /ORGANISM="Goniomonas sp, Strain m" /LENGTH=388 /DNA_ID=CAMNT_0001739905 /DNA_START=26 /DNA_END=1192 /DNA_ORIENTATION=+